MGPLHEKEGGDSPINMAMEDVADVVVVSLPVLFVVAVGTRIVFSS